MELQYVYSASFLTKRHYEKPRIEVVNLITDETVLGTTDTCQTAFATLQTDICYPAETCKWAS